MPIHVLDANVSSFVSITNPVEVWVPQIRAALHPAEQATLALGDPGWRVVIGCLRMLNKNLGAYDFSAGCVWIVRRGRKKVFCGDFVAAPGDRGACPRGILNAAIQLGVKSFPKVMSGPEKREYFARCERTPEELEELVSAATQRRERRMARLEREDRARGR